MRGRRAGYLEAALLRRGRLVELYSTFVFDVFFPKTVSKCSVDNCFIPQIPNSINWKYTDLYEDIISVAAWKQYSFFQVPFLQT